MTSVRTDAVDGRTLAWSYTYNGDLLSQVCAPDSSCTQYEYATGSHYRSAVLDSKPESYWRLGEPEGTAANSEIAVNLSRDRGTYSNVTLAAPAGLAGTTDTAASFNGSSSQLSLPAGTVKKSRDVAVELWFKIPAGGLGGPLLGYQDKPIDTTPTVGVPLVYVGANDHKLHGQFWNGRVAPITASTVNVNDGRWHHAVLSANGATQTLYLDGQVAGTLANQVVDHTTLTYNQVGVAYATTPGSWPGWGTAAKQFFAGTIDEVALYQHPLGPATVKAHFQQATAAASQLTKVTLPSGKTAAEVTYDVKLDRVDEYTDRNGGTWQVGAPTVYGDDTDLRRAIQVLDPGGRPYFYEYDALAGRIIRSGAPTALSLRDEDRPGDPATSTTTTSTTICSQPDPGDPTFCTTPPSDTSGAPEFIAHSADGVAIRAYAYDDRGFPNVITDENGDAVTLGYDDRGNVTSVKTCRTSTECHTAFYTYPTTLSVYDPRHDKPLEFRDARSASAADNTYKTGYTYTTAGNLATQTNPDGGIVRHSYTSGIEAAAGGGYMPAALVATTTDARSGVTRYAYDRSGDLAQVTEQSELVTRFTYDALGRVTSRTEVSDTFPAGVTTTYTYDDLSRLTSVTEPATTDAVTGVRHQRKTVNSYDVDGNLARTDVSDLLGGDATRSATFDYNDHNQLERVTDALGNETSYGYDLFGNLTSMVDAGGNRFGYGYTARNKLAEVRLFDWDGDPPGAPGPSTDGYIVLDSYAYDFAGRQVRHTDAMGHERILTYYQDDLLKDVTLRGFHNPDGSTRDLVLESDTYDGAGNLTRQVTGNGPVVTQQTVNPAGQVDSVTVDPSGLARRTAFGYDLNGNVTRVSRSGNASNVNFPLATQPEVVDYTYDLAGRQTRQTASTGTDTLVTSYDYDQRSLPVATTDPRGNAVGADKAAFTTTFAYDELGRQVRVEGPPVAAESGGGSPQTVHSTVLTGYDTFDEPVAVKDPLGNVTSTTYDLLGQVVQTSAPTYTPPGSAQAITPTVHARYDALGNVLEVTDPRGNATRYTYDRLNRMATRDEPATTNTERAVWNYTYTRLGDVLSVTDPTGARLETTYDDLGRTATLTEVERRPVADNFTTRYRYDDADNLTQTIAPSGAPTDNVYDAVGELTRTTDPAGVITQLGYDFAGRQVRVTDGLGRTARAAYDLAGRLVSESDLRPDGSQVRQQTYGYDLAGNLTTATDPLGHPTTYTYDAANQLVKQVEPTSDTASITTTFGYDAAGDKTRFTDGRGNSTVYTLNSLGLPESVIEPSTTAQPALADRTWTVSYDAAGNPVTVTAPGNVTRQRTFDAADRLTGETGTGAGAATVARTFGYDPAGRPTTVSAPGGNDTFAYNDRGMLLSAGGPGGTSSFAYNGDGQLTTRTDVAGTATYGYTNGRLATVKDAITATTQTLGYDAAGQVASVSFGSARVRGYGYDDLGRLTSDALKNAAGQTVSSVAYGYDAADHMTSKTTTGTAGTAANTYGYDLAGRLSSWTAGGTATNYQWDAAGNRVQAGSKTASFDARNRLLSDGTSTYAYSARGTLASKTTSGQTEPFSFDAFDRLISEGGVGYAYDGLDRVATREGAAFSYSGMSDEPAADGTATYGRGPAGELLATAQGATKRLALSDAHGDVVGAFNPADTTLGALSDSRAYDPFGQVLASAGSPSTIGFQGDWTDPQTRQADMGARWYNPATGTFNSADPMIQSAAGASVMANRYTYGAASPLDYVDPTGQSVERVCEYDPKYFSGEYPHCYNIIFAPHAPSSTGGGGGVVHWWWWRRRWWRRRWRHQRRWRRPAVASPGPAGPAQPATTQAQGTHARGDHRESQAGGRRCRQAQPARRAEGRPPAALRRVRDEAPGLTEPPRPGPAGRRHAQRHRRPGQGRRRHPRQGQSRRRQPRDRRLPGRPGHLRVRPDRHLPDPAEPGLVTVLHRPCALLHRPRVERGDRQRARAPPPRATIALSGQVVPLVLCGQLSVQRPRNRPGEPPHPHLIRYRPAYGTGPHELRCRQSTVWR